MTGEEQVKKIEQLEQDEKQAQKDTHKLRRKVWCKNAVIVILIVIIIILLLRSCSSEAPVVQETKEPEKIVIQTGEVVKEEPIVEEEKKEGRIKIPVIQDFVVSAESPYVTLFNPEGNKDSYLLKYDFTNIDTGEVIYSSDWLEGGFSYSVDMYSCLKEVGKYNTVVAVSTKDASTYENKNGAVTQLVITVAE